MAQSEVLILEINLMSPLASKENFWLTKSNRSVFTMLINNEGIETISAKSLVT